MKREKFFGKINHFSNKQKKENKKLEIKIGIKNKMKYLFWFLA